MSHLLPWEAVWGGEMHLLQVKSHVSLEPTYVWEGHPYSVVSLAFIELSLGVPGDYHKDKYSHSLEQVDSRKKEQAD